MSAYFARIAERLLGAGPMLRPMVSRYLIALHDEPAPHEAMEPGIPLRTPPVTPEEPEGVPSTLPIPAAQQPLGDRRASQPERARDERATRGVLTPPPKHLRATTLLPLQERNVPPLRAEVRERGPELPPGETRLLPLQSTRPTVATMRERFEMPREPEPPSVHVHIGRIDVRAAETPPQKAAPVRPVLRAPSLADHLRARERGVG